MLDDLRGAWDTAVFEACQWFTGLDENGKRAACREIDRDRSWAIVTWSEGMATLGVREKNPGRLVYGLVGLSLLSPDDFDERDAAVVYPLFVRAAERIGEDPDEVTGAAAELSDPVGRDWLLSLLPAARHQLPPTHEERGTGASFAFQRRREHWDPEPN